MPNRLISETSPYLLQHAGNPVDWYPWGDEALELAAREDRPLFVSIGYAACHWCHVMERESFEDEQVAAYINENFVPIKIDREERPDIDAVYMDAVQAMTGQGGWPLTVFCQPDGTPFYGGTYFPPTERGGLPSFRMVLEAVMASWNSKREEIREVGGPIRARLGASAGVTAEDSLDPGLVDRAVAGLIESADLARGGFGEAPKFPPPLALDLLLAKGEHGVVESTLAAMADGGIHDQIGGGFARYTVDADWQIPHFEKMLYDNAMLARSYLHAWQETSDPRWRQVCESTLGWILTEMVEDPAAPGSTGFFSSIDADSEGTEGRFYTWDVNDFVRTLLEAELEEDEIADVVSFWGVTPGGNFEGLNILYRVDGADAEEPACLERAREALLAARSGRVRPATDDKRILSWNALAIAALAEAGAVLGQPRYTEAAVAAADFTWSAMQDDSGRLLRSWKDGKATIPAFAEDYAYLCDALLTVYESTFDRRWYERARTVANALINLFHDPENGGFFTTGSDTEAVVARRKDITDHPIPSGNSAAAVALLRLSALSGEGRYADIAEGTLRLFSRAAEGQPLSAPWLVMAHDMAVSRIDEVAVVAPKGEPEAANRLVGTVRSRYRPRTVLAAGETGTSVPELLADRPAGDGALAYVCRNFSCRQPVATPEQLEDLL